MKYGQDLSIDRREAQDEWADPDPGQMFFPRIKYNSTGNETVRMFLRRYIADFDRLNGFKPVKYSSGVA
jgi:hypothetical protein